MRSPRGFTLMEVAVAVALSAIVLGAATAVLSSVLVQNRRQRAYSELQRDAEFVGQLLAQELRQAGSGVPPSNGHHIQQVCPGGVCNYIYGDGSSGTTTPLTFTARRILVAGATQIGILGDLPRPDSNYALFGALHSAFTGSGRDSVMWHNESNGTCAPQGGSCSTATASMFFPGTGAACTTAGGQETCPWALRRLARGDRFQIVDGRGNWGHTASETAGAIGINDGAHNNILSLRLNPSFDPNGINWKNDVAGAGPGGYVGQGWVTSLDRVFYSLDTVGGRQVIRRTQCFGDPDPSDANWPNAGNSNPANPATAQPTVAAPATSAANRCVGPEVVARNVTAVAFTYFDGTGASVVNPAQNAKDNIARVEWTINFASSDTLGNTPITYTLQGAASLQN